MRVGVRIHTPRFLTVSIKAILSQGEAREKGYTEPTHFKNANWEIMGKVTMPNHMDFAAVLKVAGDPLKCDYCGIYAPPDDADPEHGAIFKCETCGKWFCSACFEGRANLSVGEFMLDSSCLCPDCRDQRMSRYLVTFSRRGCAVVMATNEEEARRIADATISADEVSWDDDWPADYAELDKDNLD